MLARDPICTRFEVASSVIAHHVIALKDGGGWSLENGAGVCFWCRQ
ncbi:MAG TPA: hypothetical protein VHR45_15355 [Thermoanaerobaculia bacterium]|nr:hypothetical protein [Thermoanaerobaculia bacterium]